MIHQWHVKLWMCRTHQLREPNTRKMIFIRLLRFRFLIHRFSYSTDNECVMRFAPHQADCKCIAEIVAENAVSVSKWGRERTFYVRFSTHFTKLLCVAAVRVHSLAGNSAKMCAHTLTLIVVYERASYGFHTVWKCKQHFTCRTTKCKTIPNIISI